VRVIFRSPRLIALSSLCSLVTLIALAGLVWALSHWIGDWVSWVVARPENWLGRVLWYVLAALVYLVLLVVGAYSLPLLALAPLQDPLSTATEAACGDFAAPPFSLARIVRETGIALGHTATRVLLLLAGQAVLLLLNLIPGAGHVAWIVASTLWTMAWLAVEYLDSPMTRHRYTFRDVRRVVWKRLTLSLGFGAALYILLWIPILNFFLIPLAVVGGTLLFRGLRQAGALSDA
jgi:CysZ protein